MAKEKKPRFVVERVPGAQYILSHGRMPQPVPAGYALEEFQEFISFEDYVKAINNQPSKEETQEIIAEFYAKQDKDAELKTQLVNSFTSDELQVLKELVESADGAVGGIELKK